MAPLRAAPHPSWMDALMYFNALDGDQQSWSAAVSLNRVSTESGQGHREDAAAELLAILDALGYPPGDSERLAKRTQRTRTLRGKAAERRLQNATSRLEKATQKLASLLSQEAPESRRGLAELIVRIDGDHAEAREILGHRMVGGRWLDEDAERIEKKRAEIQEAIRRAHRLEIPVEVGPSGDPTLKELFGEGSVRVQAKGAVIHTNWPEAKARRILLESLRAFALTNWIVSGKLEVPPNMPYVAVVLGSKPSYLRAIEADVAAKRFPPEKAAHAGGWSSYFRQDGTGVTYGYVEADVEAAYYCHLNYALGGQLIGVASQPCLVAGHACWICMTYLGTRMPDIVWEKVERDRREGTIAGGGEAEEHRLSLLKSAGLMGCRSWLRHLAESRKDPPWSRSMKAHVAEIEADDLLKAVMVAAYLQETDRFGPLLGATRDTIGKNPAEVLASFQKALAMPLHEFEDEWKEWLLGGGRKASLLERLEESRTPGSAPTDSPVVVALARIREAALAHTNVGLVPPVELDAELTAGAQRHAEYLLLHPDQATTWPAAHEEYPDREGYTTEGAWAGLHSVIAPGVDDPVSALDDWMGTFYHRLPLLHPGLLRVGLGFSERCAVLDAGSIVRKIDLPWYITWPFDGMADVPTGFLGEFPNPVPGERQEDFGYPITLQLNPAVDGPAPQVDMSLHVGSATGPEVPCRFSSPELPTNPHVAPPGAYCLIPKEHLEKGILYVVVAETGAARIVWTFRT